MARHAPRMCIPLAMLSPGPPKGGPYAYQRSVRLQPDLSASPPEGGHYSSRPLGPICLPNHVRTTPLLLVRAMPNPIALSALTLSLVLLGYAIVRHRGRRRDQWRPLRQLGPVSVHWLADR